METTTGPKVGSWEHRRLWQMPSGLLMSRLNNVNHFIIVIIECLAHRIAVQSRQLVINLSQPWRTCSSNR